MNLSGDIQSRLAAHLRTNLPGPVENLPGARAEPLGGLATSASH